ncbi:MAG TPA: CheR family methyltransferase [Thermoanaerobaculia bacterium]|nr:CheR family methyltransferase [Thermoanaerobaculia bacterium]
MSGGEGLAQGQKERRGQQHPCPIVAIGASAGGLVELRKFFSRMAPDSGMAFVLIQHLSPHHETLMPELLAKDTAMPVQLVLDETVIETDHVYVTPPSSLLTIEDCVLRVSQASRPYGRRTPIDSFFRSLAEDQGDDAVAIVLSGHGTDGALGAQAIKEHGGLVLVQDPGSTRFDGMPRSAVATGVADLVLAVEDMPARLLEHRARVQGSYKTIEGFREDIGAHLGRICAHLRRRTGNDFSQYKQSTLVRRIRRRMHELRDESVAAYLDRLRQDPKEIDQLFQDLLIGVTHFFRDPETFELLARKVVPRLFQRDPEESVRVWVAGCATGEEAYSLAILLREHALTLENPPAIQIFATDIDEPALETARQALYPEAIASQISPERLERFFVRHGNMYQVAKELREICLFSAHNLITDPPFSRLDLLSCRNVLIYLESDLQKKLMPLCHYALRKGGFLWLGPSESIASHPELFRTVDKKHRVFQRREALIRPPLSLTLVGRSRPSPARSFLEERRPPAGEQEVAQAFERILLQSYAPPCVIVNEGGEVVYFSPRTGQFLEPPAGRPSLNLLDMVRKGLRLDLRTALHRAAISREAAQQDDIRFESEGQAMRLNLIVRPLVELGEDSGLFMVIFQEIPPARRPEPPPVIASGGSGMPQESALDFQGDLIRRLEAELRSTRDHLQATLEELESSNEELVSSNEELLSINEELQSSNEELQTSKEELQSVNEELETVNAELKKKIEELHRAHSDLQNLFESTQIATIFVDRELRIKRFTPAATEVFRLIDGDLGRPITDIAPRFGGGDLVPDIKDVLRTLGTRERQVRLTADGAWYKLRILPYRTVDNVIDGVVMTFVNVTDLKQAQSKSALLAAIVESSQDAIYSRDLDGAVTSWNAGAEKMFGYTAQEAIGGSLPTLVPEDRLAEVHEVLDRLRRGQRTDSFETLRVRKDGSPVFVQVNHSAVLDDAGEVTAFSVIARDIGERLRAREELRRSEERYRSLVAAMTSVVWATDASGSFVVPQLAWESYTGQSWREHQGWGWAEAIHPDDRERIKSVWAAALASRSPYHSESRLWHAASGRYRHCDTRAVPLLNPDGTLREWVGTISDVDDQKRAEEEIQDSGRRKDNFLAMLGHELRNPLGPIRNSLHILGLSEANESQVRRARETIERQVLHLTRIVDDLLDIARISQGKILLRKQALDLAELVRATAEDHRGPLERSGLRLEVDVASPVRVIGDPTRLSQALGNVLHNAGKFTHGGGTVTVRLCSDREEGTAEIRVRDTGIGIRPEVLELLFVPFSQAGRSGDHSGLGIGLALVKTLIEMHGGAVEAHSEGEGRGAEIVLRLPLGVGEVSLPPPVPEVPERPIHIVRCLLIEDNVDAAESLGMLLELAGHEISIAHDGPAGLAEARRFRPDVILCDIGLPGTMDGYDVARAIRSDPGVAFAYLIALTGYGQEEDQRRAHDAGFDTHLTKPADPEVLRRLLSSLPERPAESSRQE